MSVLLIVAVVFVGVLVGLMSAMFGVGGGVIMVPFLVFALDASQHLAEGTSLLVMIPTAMVGVIAHHRRGFVSFKAAAVIAVPGVVGAIGGAWLAHALDPSTLQVYFGVFTVLVGLKTLRDGSLGRAQRSRRPVSPKS